MSIDPFSIREDVDTSQQNKEQEVPEQVRKSVDEYKECKRQSKKFDGLAEMYKKTVCDFVRPVYATNAITGNVGNIKLRGNEDSVTYIVQQRSKGLSLSDVKALKEKWGDELVTSLTQKDFGSIKFDTAVLEKNYEAVISALNNLPSEVLKNLFKPMTIKAKPDAISIAADKVNNPSALAEIIADLQIVNFIR